MKRYNKLFALAAIAPLVIVGQASAQISASATGEANARILKGLSMFKTADLEFSEIISNGTGGTVTVDAEGNVEYDGVNAYPGSAAAKRTNTLPPISRKASPSKTSLTRA